MIQQVYDPEKFYNHFFEKGIYDVIGLHIMTEFIDTVIYRRDEFRSGRRIQFRRENNDGIIFMYRNRGKDNLSQGCLPSDTIRV